MPAPTVHGFAEKVALVVNGAEGVGRAVALQLALQGCYVIVSYERASEGQVSALEELRSLGTLASAFEFTDARTLVGEVDKLFGRIDLLVNCVKSEADSKFQIETVTNEALALMSYRPKPSIVDVISERHEAFFVPGLPPNFRQNCVVTKEKQTVIEHELFALNNFDDIARVVLFFLSAEARALNQQVLFVN